MPRAFGGEDPLRPVTRETLERTKRSVLSLHELVSVLTKCKLEEPDAELLADVRRYLDRGKGLFRPDTMASL